MYVSSAYVYVCVYMLYELVRIRTYACVLIPTVLKMFKYKVHMCMYMYVYHHDVCIRFNASINDCWYGRVALLFKIHVRTDEGEVKACSCAMMETLWDYCPGESQQWWRSRTGHIGTKQVYLPGPVPRVWIVPVSSILGRLPLVPVGDTGTIPHSMHLRQQSCFPGGTCDAARSPGSGSPLFYINSWAMVWPSDQSLQSACE